jgi:hypothetical protein
MSSIWLTAPTMTTNDRDGEYYYLFLKGSDIFQEVSFALIGGVRMSNDKAITTATTTTNDRDGEYYYLFLKGFDIAQEVSFALLRGVCMSNDRQGNHNSKSLEVSPIGSNLEATYVRVQQQGIQKSPCRYDG